MIIHIYIYYIFNYHYLELMVDVVILLLQTRGEGGDKIYCRYKSIIPHVRPVCL